jgi:hypothetical protein
MKADGKIGAVLYRRSELGEYFCRCVETVRREVGGRSNKGTCNFFSGGAAVGLEDFKKIDLLRLMELVFTD